MPSYFRCSMDVCLDALKRAVFHSWNKRIAERTRAASYQNRLVS